MLNAIKVRCPKCRNALRRPRESLDAKVRCEHCSHTFRAVVKADVVATPQVASEVATAPPTIAPAADGPGGEFNFEVGPAVLLAPPRRSSATRRLAFLSGLALVTAAGVGIWLYYSGWLGTSPENRGASTGKPGGTAVASQKSVATTGSEKPVKAPPFPRRFLFIGIHQYAYANPLSPTPTTLLMPMMLREFAQRKLRVDKDQVTILSDLAEDREARPPLKADIIQTIEQFLSTSRAQDRIMIVFVGHAVDVDEQPYLVPIEGELGVKESLIPLSWVYDRLAACSARQKVLVIDTCRIDSARGLERPGSGPMGPKLDAALANPPPGVQVWSACTANQYSYEFEEASMKNVVARGGAFLSLFTQAFAQGGNTQKPDEPWPLNFMVQQVQAPVQEIVAQREAGAMQTPRLTGEAPADGAAYDPDEPPPPRVTPPNPAAGPQGGRADPKEMERLIAEIAVPPLKLPRELKNQPSAERQAATLAATFPFTAAAMTPYAADYQDLRALLDKPKDYPLRLAVLQTVETLDRQGRLNRVKVGDKEVAADRLIETVRNAGNDDKVKKSLTKSQQDGPALMLVELQEALETMEKAGRNRDREPSKRWQAHYDYVLACLKMRMVYVNEYNAMIAKVKRDELPPLDPKLHNGWRLAAQEKITSPKEVKDLASDARKLLAKLIQEHAGTPWEILAKRERSTALGLAWQPTNLSKD